MEEEVPSGSWKMFRRILFNEDGHFPTIMAALREGGLAYCLCHVAFVAAIALALVVILQRRPRAWCLLASILPLLVAGFAYHFRWLALFHRQFAPSLRESPTGPIALDPSLPNFESVQGMFIYDIRFFWWALIAWIVLSAMSFFHGRPLAHTHVEVQNLSAL